MANEKKLPTLQKMLEMLRRGEMTVSEAAILAGVTRQAIGKAIAVGKLSARPIGLGLGLGKIRLISARSLVNYIKSRAARGRKGGSR